MRPIGRTNSVWKRRCRRRRFCLASCHCFRPFHIGPSFQRSLFPTGYAVGGQLVLGSLSPRLSVLEEARVVGISTLRGGCLEGIFRRPCSWHSFHTGRSRRGFSYHVSVLNMKDWQERELLVPALYDPMISAVASRSRSMYCVSVMWWSIFTTRFELLLIVTIQTLADAVFGRHDAQLREGGSE